MSAKRSEENIRGKTHCFPVRCFDKPGVLVVHQSITSCQGLGGEVKRPGSTFNAFFCLHCQPTVSVRVSPSPRCGNNCPLRGAVSPPQAVIGAQPSHNLYVIGLQSNLEHGGREFVAAKAPRGDRNARVRRVLRQKPFAAQGPGEGRLPHPVVPQN